jgi:hypothetical protein
MNVSSIQTYHHFGDFTPAKESVIFSSVEWWGKHHSEIPAFHGISEDIHLQILFYLLRVYLKIIWVEFFLFGISRSRIGSDGNVFLFLPLLAFETLHKKTCENRLSSIVCPRATAHERLDQVTITSTFMKTCDFSRGLGNPHREDCPSGHKGQRLNSGESATVVTPCVLNLLLCNYIIRKVF